MVVTCDFGCAHGRITRSDAPGSSANIGDDSEMASRADESVCSFPHEAGKRQVSRPEKGNRASVRAAAIVMHIMTAEEEPTRR